jgi:MFS family permease
MVLPLATAIGAPISTAFLQLDGLAGLHGWRWVFLGEGIPTVFIGLTVFFVLTERPAAARWLKSEERDWLDAELARERHTIEAVRAHSILSAMINPRVLILTVIFAGVGMASVGLVLFLPQILKPSASAIPSRSPDRGAVPGWNGRHGGLRAHLRPHQGPLPDPGDNLWPGWDQSGAGCDAA